MGADLLLCALPAAQIDEERRRVLDGLIDGMPLDELNCIADSMCWGTCADDEDQEEVAAQATEIRDRLKRALDIVAGCGNGEPFRASTVFQLPGWPYQVMFTGGLSWGDEPTDLFDDFQAVSISDRLWAALEQFAREDAAPSPQQVTP